MTSIDTRESGLSRRRLWPQRRRPRDESGGAARLVDLLTTERSPASRRVVTSSRPTKGRDDNIDALSPGP